MVRLVGRLVGWPTQRIIHQRARERILHDYLILMTLALPGYVSIAVSAQQIRFLVEFHVANLSSSMKKFPASCHRCPCNECLLCAPFDLLYFGEQPKRTAGAMVKAIKRVEGEQEREQERVFWRFISSHCVEWAVAAAADAEQLKIFA